MPAAAKSARKKSHSRHTSPHVVPDSYAGFFAASSAAAGALIGLLFVVIALKPGQMVGRHAELASRGLASSSFTALVNAFFVSLLALIPGHNIGIGAAVLAVVSMYYTVRLQLGRPGAGYIVTFVASLLTYGIELFIAVAFILRPHDVGLVRDLAFVLIACFAVALGRAWQLMESAAVGTTEAPTAGS